MALQAYISQLSHTLSTATTVAKAYELMASLKLNELPLVDDNLYKGLLREEDLYDFDDADSLSLLEKSGFNYKPALTEYAHPLDAAKLLQEQHLQFIPIVGTEQNYVGIVSRASLLPYFTEDTGISISGGIIVLEVKMNNYSLSEMARICENEDVLILFSHIQKSSNQEALLITLKTNKTDLSAVRASFERYNYYVVEVYGQDNNLDYLKDRYDLLMNYLSM